MGPDLPLVFNERLTLEVGLSGATSRVLVDGQPLPGVTRAVLTLEAGQVTKLELTLYPRVAGPGKVEGYLIKQEDYDAWQKAKCADA